MYKLISDTEYGCRVWLACTIVIWLSTSAFLFYQRTQLHIRLQQLQLVPIPEPTINMHKKAEACMHTIQRVMQSLDILNTLSQLMLSQTRITKFCCDHKKGITLYLEAQSSSQLFQIMSLCKNVIHGTIIQIQALEHPLRAQLSIPFS